MEQKTEKRGRRLFLLPLLCTGALVLAGFVLWSCTKDADINVDDYTVSVAVVNGVLSPSGEIVTLPRLRVTVDGPSGGAHGWKLDAALPGDYPISAVLDTGKEQTVELGFYSFTHEGRRNGTLSVTIHKSWDGLTLYSGLFEVGFDTEKARD